MSQAAWVEITWRGGAPVVKGVIDHVVAFDRLKSNSIDTVDHSLAAGWKWNGQSLRLFGDRLGFIPIFYIQDSNRLIVSTELSSLCKRIQPAFDTVALSVFFHLGFFVGEDTPISGVKVLPPGGTAVWQNGRFNLSAPKLPSSKINISRSDAVQQYNELFAKSIERRIGHSDITILPLSGGRDSRHILAELSAQDKLPQLAISLDRRGNTDAKIAAAVSGRLNIPHVVAKQQSHLSIGCELRKNLMTHCLSDEHSWYLDLLAAFPRSLDAIVDGIGGDVLSNGLFFDRISHDLMVEGRLTACAEHLLMNHGMLPGPTSAASRASRALAVERVSLELAKHAHMPDPTKSFWFWNRTRREVALAPICIASDVADVRLPFVDAELLEFLLSLDPVEFGMPGFHDEVLLAAYPTLADIPFSKAARASRDLRIGIRQRVETARWFLGTNTMRGAFDPSFVWPRLLRAITLGPEREMWWISHATYLLSLQMLSGQSDHHMPATQHIREAQWSTT